jgi:hypothetical protein
MSWKEITKISNFHLKEATIHFVSYDFRDECLIAQRVIDIDIGLQGKIVPLIVGGSSVEVVLNRFI